MSVRGTRGGAAGRGEEGEGERGREGTTRRRRRRGRTALEVLHLVVSLDDGHNGAAGGSSESVTAGARDERTERERMEPHEPQVPQKRRRSVLPESVCLSAYCLMCCSPVMTRSSFLTARLTVKLRGEEGGGGQGQRGTHGTCAVEGGRTGCRCWPCSSCSLRSRAREGQREGERGRRWGRGRRRTAQDAGLGEPVLELDGDLSTVALSLSHACGRQGGGGERERVRGRGPRRRRRRGHPPPVHPARTRRETGTPGSSRQLTSTTAHPPPPAPARSSRSRANTGWMSHPPPYLTPGFDPARATVAELRGYLLTHEVRPLLSRPQPAAAAGC